MQKDNSKYSALADAARAVLAGNRHRGQSQWENRPFDFVCPSNVTYPYQWFWDSCFHAIALTHVDVALAQQELVCLLQAAQPNGFIPHMILWERERYLEQTRKYNIAMMNDYLTAITQPPVLAQAIERVYQASQNAQFLADVLPKTKAYYRWWIQHRDPDHDNLVAIVQPDESGLDALPGYDALLKMPSVNRSGLNHAMQRIFAAMAPVRDNAETLFAADVFVVEDVMVNSIYAQGLRALARLCRITQATEDATEFDTLAGRVEQAVVDKCFDVKRGIFFDRCGIDEVPSNVVTITSLFPLILDHLDPQIARRVVDEHLHNPKEFWLPFPLPSVAATEPSFDPDAKTGLLWRGPTWINTNWFLVGGLRQQGFGDLADELITRTLEMVSRGGIREYYNPYTGAGYGAPNFGWSTLILDWIA